ncbi:hypothetical protein FZEAL_9994 [Fusarium zealandicum]|uniref:Uncharacterized protein n=1 Tax=Fusarium zealandicum TaxID=1053134 RepID=A0A8H4U6W6_9HYPO|nr:hypothetical protein FZEAL_9994 [Fusarium zealandicum]
MLMSTMIDIPRSSYSVFLKEFHGDAGAIRGRVCDMHVERVSAKIQGKRQSNRQRLQLLSERDKHYWQHWYPDWAVVFPRANGAGRGGCVLAEDGATGVTAGDGQDRLGSAQRTHRKKLPKRMPKLHFVMAAPRNVVPAVEADDGRRVSGRDDPPG